MATSLEAAAKDWLSDPPWNKLFKNSFDVVEDQINRGLVALAAISLAVRFLANLPSGDLLCIVVGVGGNTSLTMDQLAGPFHASLAAYAAQNPECHKQVFVNPTHEEHPGYILYVPIIMMLQALCLIGLEKVWMIFPKLSQKLERFYKSVVEEALLGKDPDVAEDFKGGKIDWEKVVRERQREEICGALRSSSLFYRMYVMKNTFEIILAIIFMAFNCWFCLSSDNEIGFCNIKMGINAGYAQMQCQQKRYDFFIAVLYGYIFLQGMHLLISTLSLIWSIKFFKLRRITSIIDYLKGDGTGLLTQSKSLTQAKRRHMSEGLALVDSKGADFLFLFDLIAHSSGLPATLRVLSYTAPTFAEVCQPKNFQLNMTETSISLVWNPCPLQMVKTNKMMEVQKYVVTIFPYSRDHIKTVWAEPFEAEFQDLVGGKREYVVTISAIIGDAKMKGVSRTTCLPPFPPQNLSYVPVEDSSAGTAIKIRWSRPKGEFDKYILKVSECHKDAEEYDRERTNSLTLPNGNRFLVPSTFPHTQTVTRGHTSFKVARRQREPDEIYLGSDEVEYVKTNLKPGVRYQLQLRSMTGNQSNVDEKVPKLQIVTKPLPPPINSFKVKPSSSRLEVSWEEPGGDGHTCLEAYKLWLRSADDVILKEKTVSKFSLKFTFENTIVSGSQYKVELASLARDQSTLNTGDLMRLGELEAVSTPVSKTVVTPPLPPTNLRLEAVAATSLKVKWDPPAHIPPQGRLSYSLGIYPVSETVRRVMADDRNAVVDSTVYQFSKLPEIVGTGAQYRVSVTSVYTPVAGGASHTSEAVTEVFTTKPLPPEKLVVKEDQHVFTWFKSPSPTVNHYKVKIRREQEKSEEFKVDLERDPVSKKGDIIFFELPSSVVLERGVEYKMNIYSLVKNETSESGWLESEPLFEMIGLGIRKEEEDTEASGDMPDEDLRSMVNAAAKKLDVTASVSDVVDSNIRILKRKGSKKGKKSRPASRAVSRAPSMSMGINDIGNTGSLIGSRFDIHHPATASSVGSFSFSRQSSLSVPEGTASPKFPDANVLN